MATILVVDDRYVNRQYLVTLLGYSGHRMLEAADGIEALALARAQRPDLVITDIVMPEMDGLELSLQLRNEPATSGIPVIFYSSTYLEREAQALAKSAGVKYVVSKPADPEIMIATVNEALGYQPVSGRASEKEFETGSAPDDAASDLPVRAYNEHELIAERMTALNALGMELASEREPERLLHLFCRATRKIIGARFSAVGLLQDARTFAPFVTSGVSVEVAATITAPAADAGYMERILSGTGAMRVAKLNLASTSSLEPAFGAWPQIEGISFLGTKIEAHDHVYGVLYLTGKLGLNEFTEEDERVAVTLAAQFAVAYENVRLYEEVQERAATLETEISERRKVEAALRDSEERYRTLADAAPDSVFIVDRDGIFQYVNKSSAAAVGLTPEKMLGTCTDDYFPPDLAKANLNTFRQVLETSKPAYIEVPLITDGVQSWQSAWVVPLKTGADETSFVMGVSRDITLQKQVELALRESEERFRQMAENVNEVFWMTDPATSRMIYISPAYESIWGRTCQSLYETPESFIEGIHPDDRAAVLDALMHKIKFGDFKIEYRVLHYTDGSTRWVWDQAFPIRDAEGKIYRVVGIAQDITDRKRAEAALKLERDFSSAVIDTVGSLVVVVDRERHIVRFNRACELLSGYSFEEMQGKSPLEVLIGDKYRQTFENALERIQRGEVREPVEIEWTTRDGRRRLIAWNTTTLPDEYGDVEFFIGTGTDITERRQMMEDLSRANEDLESRVERRTAELAKVNAELNLRKTILESQSEASIDGILMVNAERRIASINRRFCEMWSLPYPLAEPLLDAHALHEVLNNLQTSDTYLTRLEELYAHPDARSEDELILRDGRTFERFGSPVVDEYGIHHGRIWFFHNATDRKQFESSIRLARDEAETANLAKSEFLSRMSHELRTPLNAIIGFGQLLERKETEPRAQERINQILKAGYHLLELINEVLDIARVESGNIHLSLEPVSVNLVVGEVIDLVRPLADNSHIVLINQIEPADDTHVLADIQRLKQVLINLFSNAVKYNFPEGRVTVSSSATAQGRLRMSIADSGPGIDPAAAGKLFTPFERLGAERSDVEGTGLGLVLSKHLAEAMNGTLTFESVVGKGTTFTIELPIATNDSARPDRRTRRQIPASEVTAGRQKSKVLSIEDNPSNYKLVEDFFQEHPDIELLSAFQGSVGFDLARHNHPDLILLDLHLPDIPGWEVLRKLKGLPETANIPVVIVSADATASQKERLMAAGATAYLTKPLDLNALERVLAELLDREV